VALKDLVSDLSNFKTKGDVAYDKLDPQINNGVDYFPDDTSGAKGFTPKTDLESKYNKFMKDVRQNNSLPNRYESQANISAPNSGRRINPRSRTAYGVAGEYLEGEGVGMSMTNHVLSSDTVLGVRLQPQFTSEFMTTPIANHISGFSPPSDLSQTFSLASNADEVTRFNYWKTFSAIGGSVDKFASLIPSTIRISQFSFPERDRENNIDVNPNGFSGLKTTLNLPRESWRYSTTDTNDVFKDTFSTLGLGSSNYTDIIDNFHKYDGGDFINLPGLGDDNKFFNRSLGEGGKFRNVADPENLIHPIILRPFGSNWKDAGTDLQIPDLKFSNHEYTFNNVLSVDGFSLSEMSARNIADNSRLEKWALTPQGASFIDKQFSLQRLNPTIETKQYNRDSFLGVAGNLSDTTVPVFHPERHVGGFATRYENVLNLTGLNPEPGIQFTGGSRLAFQSAAFSVDIAPLPRVSPSGNSFLDGIANFAIGAFNALANPLVSAINLGLSNPNKYSPFPSSAPVSTKLGYVAFGNGLLQIPIDVAIANLKPGGNFNKSTAVNNDGNPIKRHYTSAYGQLVGDTQFDYSRTLASPSEVNPLFGDESNTDVVVDQVATRNKYKFISSDIGHQGAHMGKKIDDVLGVIKGDKKSDNVDRINVMPIVQTGDSRIEDNKDFIKFRFRDLVNERYVIFRAILDGITDAVVPEYGEEKYIGRPNKVFVYQGAERTVNFNFSIYPKTKQELPILVQKLEYLIGLCYPSYTEQNFMKTPFIALTLGDMFVDAPGVLSGLTITVEDQTTWELDEGLQFPHFIKAQCEFKYIGNRKLKTSGIHYDLGKTTQEFFPASQTYIDNLREPLPVNPTLRQNQLEGSQ